jgi:hypothetical protein
MEPKPVEHSPPPAYPMLSLIEDQASELGNRTHPAGTRKKNRRDFTTKARRARDRQIWRSCLCALVVLLFASRLCAFA